MEIKKVLLTPNSYSRPQTKRTKVTHIIIHWVGNANTSAKANRDYFEGLRNQKIYASAHYIIGLEGEILQCIPEDEIAYHANSANCYSIGIENCHPDWYGKFNSKTYTSLIELCAQLCKKYHLDPEKALLRHYDITKKMCPKYYVEHTDAWFCLKKDVKSTIQSPNEDEKLLEGLKVMISKGVQLDIKIWGNMSTMNMKYARLMVERIGQRFDRINYTDTIDFLVAKGCINNREIWDKEQFKPKWCRALLMKVYQVLFI